MFSCFLFVLFYFCSLLCTIFVFVFFCGDWIWNIVVILVFIPFNIKKKKFILGSQLYNFFFSFLQLLPQLPPTTKGILAPSWILCHLTIDTDWFFQIISPYWPSDPEILSLVWLVCLVSSLVSQHLKGIKINKHMERKYIK